MDRGPAARHYAGDDDLDDEAAINRWRPWWPTPDELGRLPEAIAFNASGDEDEGDELDR